MDPMEKELDRLWKSHRSCSVDVRDELSDLCKVYMDAEEHLKSREACALDQLTNAMKRYMDIQEERKKVSLKLSNLKAKMCDTNDHREDEDE